MTPLSDAITGMPTARFDPAAGARGTRRARATSRTPARRSSASANDSLWPSRLKKASICSPVISSSYSERSTSIAAPASSSALTVSRSSPSGPAPTISGCGRRIPEVRGAEIHHFSLASDSTRLRPSRSDGRNRDARELLVDGVPAFGGRLRLLDERLVARGIGALDHAEARLVAHVVGDLRLRRTVVEVQRRLRPWRIRRGSNR